MGKKRTRQQRLSGPEQPQRRQEKPQQQQQQEEQQQQKEQQQQEEQQQRQPTQPLPFLPKLTQDPQGRRHLDSSSESSNSETSLFSTATKSSLSTKSSISTTTSSETAAKYLTSIAETGMMSMISGREEPGEDEVRHYYDGLNSKPRLFARSGTDSWPPAPPPYSPEESALYGDLRSPAWSPDAVRKRLGPISGPFSDKQHALVAAWPELRDGIITSLNSSLIKDCWTILYPTRITTDWVNRRHYLRHEGCKTSQVTVLVGISHPAIQKAASSMEMPIWAIAMLAVTEIQQVLDDRGIADVRVEAYEAEVFPLAGSPEPDTKARGQTSEERKSQDNNQHDIEHLFEMQYVAKARDMHGANDVVDSLARIPMKFLHYPGQMLECTTPDSTGHGDSYHQTGTTGSLSLYLGLGPQPADPQNRTGKVFALANRHVAVANNLDANVTYHYHAEEGESGDKSDKSEEGRKTDKMVVLWGEERALQLAANDLEEIRSLIGMTAQARMKHALDDDDFDSDTIDSSFACADMYLPALSQAMKDIAHHSYGGRGNLNSNRRELGHVVLSAKHDNTTRLAWSDWALIELNNTAATIVHGRRRPNRIPAGPVRSALFYTHIVHQSPSVANFLPRLFDKFKFIRMQGTRLPGTLEINEDEPAHTVQDTKDKGKEKATVGPSADTPPDAHRRPFPAASEWVFKRGPTTDFTLGLTNEVEAVVRKPLKDDKYRVAYSLLIYPTLADTSREVFKGPKDMFSNRGDSGSAVVGLDSSVIAMLDGGVGRLELGRLYLRPPSVLPTVEEEIESAATTALAAAKNTTVPSGFRPATGSAIPGQGDIKDNDMDVTLATPIDWVLEEIEATLGQPVHLL